MTDGSARSAFSALPGAVLGDGTPAPLHYGGFLREQRELAAGRALVDLAGLGIVRVSGADRRSWMDSITSQRLVDLAPGASAETLLLAPDGRIEHAIGVLATDDALLLLVDPAAAEPLASWLNRMRFLRDVRVEDISAEVRAVGWHEPDGGTAAALVRELAPDAPIWRDPWGEPPAWSHSYRAPEAVSPAPWPLRIAVLTTGDHEALAAGAASGGVRAAGLLALEALRIAAWRPKAADVDSRAIPHELDWLRSAVHLEKGCYRGQETVAKVHNLGRPPRRLAMLHLDGSDGEAPTAGTMLTAQGADPDRPVGRITASAIHFEDGPIALALLRRQLDPAAVLEAPLPSGGTASASQVAIVAPDAGRTVEVPRLPRLGSKPRDRA